MENIRYRRNVHAAKEFRVRVEEYLSSGEFRNICDIGGGRNPLISQEQLSRLGLEYTLLDISADELRRAPAGYQTLQADVSGRSFPAKAQFDFVFSRMLAEHVSSGERFHRNVFDMLRAGGLAFHFFPTLYTFPFIINRIFPETLASSVLNLVRPRDRNKQGKFPARYSWCFGPTKRQLARLEGIGYRIEEYTGFYGHGYYQHIPGIRKLHACWMDWLVEHPNPYLTSFAFVVLRKP